MNAERAIEILRLAAKKLDEMTKPGEVRQYKTMAGIEEVCRWIWETQHPAKNPLEDWMAAHFIKLATIPDYYPQKRAPKPADTGTLQHHGGVMVASLNGFDYLLIQDHHSIIRCFVSDAGRLREIQFPGETPTAIS